MFTSLPGGLRRVGLSDRVLMRLSAALPATPADRALTALTRTADHGRLWWAVAAALSTRTGAPRRCAFRGLAAVAGASVTANLLGKPLLPRRRPAVEAVPAFRRPAHRPTSSSFPSGHAASAAAFVTAAFLESPRLGWALLPLGAAVSYSRVHIGVHWPSDIAAGSLLGTAAGFATRHWWPRRPDTPARAARPAHAPALGRGASLLVTVNRHSGDLTDPTEDVRTVWPDATLLDTGTRTELRTRLAERVRDHQARSTPIRALGVAGGDGTVAAVASVAAEHGLPLALIPAGTLNHFARDLGIAALSDTGVATGSGTAARIDLGEVRVEDDTGSTSRWFVNTAGLGGYPEIVRLRETTERRHPKWPAAVLATARVLRRARPMLLSLNGVPTSVWMLFVGNGTYTLTSVVPVHRPALDTGLLDVRYLRADRPYSRLRFVLAALTNTLGTSHVHRRYALPALDIELLDGNRRVATDGELGPLGHRFRFRARPSALTVYRPAPDDSA